MTEYDPQRQKPHANRLKRSESLTLTRSNNRESAYTDDELNRIEQTLGTRARRRAAHIFDIEQMHLSDFHTDTRTDAETTITVDETNPRTQEASA